MAIRPLLQLLNSAITAREQPQNTTGIDERAWLCAEGIIENLLDFIYCSPVATLLWISFHQLKMGTPF